jgi:hypothetical protein
MTCKPSKDWLAPLWKRRPKEFLRKWRTLLMLDVYNGCLTPEIKTTTSCMNMDFVVVSQGMTSQLQVLDVLVNKLLKTT